MTLQMAVLAFVSCRRRRPAVAGAADYRLLPLRADKAGSCGSRAAGSLRVPLPGLPADHRQQLCLERLLCTGPGTAGHTVSAL